MSDKVAVVEHRGVLDAVPTQETAGVLDLMQRAVASGMSAESMERLVSLYERMADRQAAQEFARAFAEFQRRCPPIPKTSIAKVTTDGGGQFSYRYSKLDEIARTANPILADLGFSYGWDSEETDTSVKATCTLRHASGHSVSASAVAPIQARSKATSQAQNGSIARTFAMRNSLVQVLGITSADPDTDGADHSAVISASQAADIDTLIADYKLSPERVKKFLDWLKVDSVASIKAMDYVAAVEALQKAGKK